MAGRSCTMAGTYDRYDIRYHASYPLFTSHGMILHLIAYWRGTTVSPPASGKHNHIAWLTGWFFSVSIGAFTESWRSTSKKIAIEASTSLSLKQSWNHIDNISTVLLHCEQQRTLSQICRWSMLLPPFITWLMVCDAVTGITCAYVGMTMLTNYYTRTDSTASIKWLCLLMVRLFVVWIPCDF